MRQMQVRSRSHIPLGIWILLWLVLAVLALLFAADPAARIPPISDAWAPSPRHTNGAE